MFLNLIILSIIVFLVLIKYLIILEVILSWLILFGIMIHIGFIQSITKPIYDYIKSILPTSFGIVDFTPIIVIIGIEIINSILINIFPGALVILQNFL